MQQGCDSPTLGGHASISLPELLSQGTWLRPQRSAIGTQETSPTQIQTALGITISTASKNKLAGVFGSYGWSGEAIDQIEGKLKDAGYKFGFEPIRVKFTPNDGQRTGDESLMHTGDKFVVNILSEGKQLQKHFMKRFAPREDRLAGLSTDTGDNGCPILTEALAYLECTVHHPIECGDHWVIYGVTEKGQVLQPDGISASMPSGCFAKTPQASVHHRKSGSYYWVGAEAS